MTFTRYQKFVVGILAFLQFTIILDFMILSPLGAILMPALRITPAQFGWVVSVYAFSAGSAGLLAAGFADRFDRKRLLLFFYAGFVLGTFLCAVASDYRFLLLARVITGLFAGVVGSTTYAITTDLFDYSVRGRVMGVLQTAFGASQVLGIPVGLFLSNHWGWHMPFFLIVAVSGLVGVVIALRLKPVDAHLKSRPDKSAVHHLIQTVTTPRYLHAFATTALLSTGGFMLMPFGSAFTVNNLGIAIEKLPLIYLITGSCTLVIGPLVGRLGDAIGKFNLFCFGSAFSIVMVTIYTHLGVTQIWIVILISVLMFVGIFSRMIASQTMMSAIPDPLSRGSFMSVSSAVQQMSGGIASILAGLIVLQGPGGKLERFDALGYTVVLAVLITLALMYTIERSIRAAASGRVPSTTTAESAQG